MMHGAPRTTWLPSPQPENKTTPVYITPASETPKVSFPLPILKGGKSNCIKRASTGEVQGPVNRGEAEGRKIGLPFVTYALVDPGSELSLMSRQALRALKLNRHKEELFMVNLHGDALMAVQWKTSRYRRSTTPFLSSQWNY